MKFNRTTVILVILALGLGIFVYVTENRDNWLTQPDSNQQTTSAPIFPFTTAQIKTLTIETPSEKISFNQTHAEIKPWRMTYPRETKASDAAIAFLTNLFSQAMENVTIPATEENLAQYGLTQPQGKIILTLENGNQYQVNLGNSNFDNSKIYALVVFPPSQSPSSQIFLVSKSFQYAIERDFQEWIEKEDIDHNQ